MRHGYTNDTRSDGSIVVKRYAGPFAEIRRSTELAVLSRIGDAVPVPRLLGDPAGALRLEHVGGVHGQELIDDGHAAPVLRSCGQTLRRLQSIDVAAIFPDPPPRAGPVLVHGDYGPNNMLFDPVTFAVTAVLDWEWSCPGDPVEDLAWCEWIVRMHHPAATADLEHLFTGYGSRPPWLDRQAAMLAKCRQMLALPRAGGMSAPGARRWQRNIDRTLSWTD
jgi:Ser/Thr protein kinase RdoA (MazF antagonist)